MIEAAAIPETYFTVWTNVFERGKLTRGESILIHGGTSGIGTTAIQLARAFGAHVLTTAGSDEKCEAARALGAAHAFNYRTTDWVAAAKTATDGRGVDVVLDMVGGDYMARNLDVLALEGRLVQIAFLKSPKAELDFSVMMRKRAWITGSTLRPRTPAQKGVIARAVAPARLAAARSARGPPDHSPGVSAGTGRRRPPAHGGRHSHWQDRPPTQIGPQMTQMTQILGLRHGRGAPLHAALLPDVQLQLHGLHVRVPVAAGGAVSHSLAGRYRQRGRPVPGLADLCLGGVGADHRRHRRSHGQAQGADRGEPGDHGVLAALRGGAVVPGHPGPRAGARRVLVGPAVLVQRLRHRHRPEVAPRRGAGLCRLCQHPGRRRRAVDRPVGVRAGRLDGAVPRDGGAEPADGLHRVAAAARPAPRDAAAVAQARRTWSSGGS